MKEIQLKTPLVSVIWLRENLDADNLVVLYATLPKAGLGEDSLTDVLIPAARFMDMKNGWAQKDARFPNTMLSPDEFQQEARKLGINKNSAVVVYDQHGIYSSARAWYMFRAMGHDNVAVLDGGLPAWKQEGNPVQAKSLYQGNPGNFTSDPGRNFFVNYKWVYDQLEDPSVLILDARANERFLGLVEEPREGLRSGHIPNSKSMAFDELQVNGKMKDKDALESIFSQKTHDDQTLVFSCGSGVTACVLALGAELTGRSKVSVYDGSWTEWGSLKELPIEK